MYALVYREIIRDGCKYQQRQGDYQRWYAHISKRAVIRAAMHASAVTGKLSEAVCVYHQGHGGHQRWCACISKNSEIIRQYVCISI